VGGLCTSRKKLCAATFSRGTDAHAIHRPRANRIFSRGGNAKQPLPQHFSTAGLAGFGDIGANLHTLHVGPRGRHIILFRTAHMPGGAIDVLRILHDAMDFARHLPVED
jgi:hypothetical protein